MNTKLVWWLSPLALIALSALLIVVSYLIPASDYATIYNSSKYLSTEMLALYAAIFLLFLFGCLVATVSRPGRSASRNKTSAGSVLSFFDRGKLDIGVAWSIYKVVVALCFIAYAIWYVNFFRLNGFGVLASSFDLDAWASDRYSASENAGHVSGITTCTELEMIAIPLGFYIQKFSSDSAAVSRVRRDRIPLILLVLFRAYIFSERIALISCLVVGLVAWFALFSSGKYRLFKLLFPVIAIVALLVIFGVFEYARTWLDHYYLLYDSYPVFVVERVAGYYANAINTECAYIAHVGASILPFRTAEWIWKLPGLSGLYEILAPVNVPVEYTYVLNHYVSPEFNNPGGILAFYTDFGPLAFLFEFLLGFFVGRIYDLFRRQNMFGFILYPFVVYALLEMPRYFAFGASRNFCFFVCLLAILVFASQKAKASSRSARGSLGLRIPN